MLGIPSSVKLNDIQIVLWSFTLKNYCLANGTDLQDIETSAKRAVFTLCDCISLPSMVHMCLVNVCYTVVHTSYFLFMVSDRFPGWF